MRAMAIALVVFQHGALFYYICYGAPAIWTKIGTIGVTMFFALSGFLIGGILLEAGDSLGTFRIAARFWLRRALRTLPNYYLFILVNLAYWYLIQRAKGYPSPIALLPRYVFFLQNFSSKQMWFFAESWSLSVEEWFYVLFPLGLFIGIRLFRWPFGRLFWALAVSMIVIPVVLRGLTLSPEDWESGITKVVIYRPDSIAMGLVAVALRGRFPAAWTRFRFPAAAVGAVVVAGSFVYMGCGDPDHSGVARTFLPLAINAGCALLLPLASTCTNLGGKALNSSVSAVARWSYSMYLVNLMISSTVLSHVQFHYGNAAGIIAYSVACICASAAIYHWFEAPILRWRDSRIYLGSRTDGQAASASAPLAAAPG